MNPAVIPTAIQEKSMSTAKHTPAAQFQADREAKDLANHRERITWLSVERPKWSCGALVDCHTRNVLLRQSLDFVAKATGASQ